MNNAYEKNLKDFSIPLQDGQLYYISDWLSAGSQLALYQALSNELCWAQDEIKVFGKWHKIPRLQAWHGDSAASYQYSGKTLTPALWTPSLKLILEKLSFLQLTFNSVLANWYRDGHDKMGWHSDNEAELGLEPVIASVSLGATRSFHLRHRLHGSRVNMELEPGSLLVMGGAMQHYWQHALPARKRVTEGRINLTFRHVRPVFN